MRRADTKPRVPESNVLLSVGDYLTQRRIFHWRANTGGAYYGEQFVRFNIPGMSDYCGLLPPTGRFLAIECKGTGGRLSMAQSTFLEAVRDAGGIGVVVWPENWLEILEQVLGLWYGPKTG